MSTLCRLEDGRRRLSYMQRKESTQRCRAARKPPMMPKFKTCTSCGNTIRNDAGCPLCAVQEPTGAESWQSRIKRMKERRLEELGTIEPRLPRI